MAIVTALSAEWVILLEDGKYKIKYIKKIKNCSLWKQEAPSKPLRDLPDSFHSSGLIGSGKKIQLGGSTYLVLSTYKPLTQFGVCQMCAIFRRQVFSMELRLVK